MSAYIYLEGGANGENSKYLKVRCQEAFCSLLDRLGFKGRKPRLVACGGRNSVYDRFCTEHRVNQSDYVAMWIDSEEPLADLEAAWGHLQQVKTVTAWKKPEGATDDQVLFMTTCMETWIVADRDSLRSFYKQKFKEGQLPPLNDLEKRGRGDVQECLENATRGCKNAYAKGKRSFDVLMVLDTSVLRQHLPSFARVERILNERLPQN